MPLGLRFFSYGFTLACLAYSMKSLEELEKFALDCRVGLGDPDYEIDGVRWVAHLMQLVRSVRLETRSRETLLEEMREQVAELRGGGSGGCGGPR